MADKEYTTSNGKSKPKLKLARIHPKPPIRLRLGGFEPIDDMQPGEYKVQCEAASKKSFGHGGVCIEVNYRVIDGEHAGTALRQWFTVNASGLVSPRSRLALQCGVALGRPLDTSDDLNNPASIFSGRIFKAFVGYRKTEKVHGGKDSPENAYRRKDKRDGLRVHELLAREEL
jgi:hypothetical protein